MARKMQGVVKIAISLLLIAVMCFSGVAFASPGPPLPALNPGEAGLTATEEEQKTVEEFLQTVFFSTQGKIIPYDSKRVEYDSFVENILTDKSGKSQLYNSCFGEAEPTEYDVTPDPLRKFSSDADKSYTGSYFVYEKDNIDWIFYKILNVSATAGAVFNTDSYEGDGFYFYEDKLYVAEKKFKTAGSMNISVKNLSQRENGRYVADIENIPSSGERASSFKAVLAFKEYSGTRRWTLYYVGNSSGVDEALRNNPLVISVDNNSFLNAATAFITYDERARYYTDKENLQALTRGVPNNLKNALGEYMAGGWGGSSYGIAASMLLNFTGKRDFSKYYEGEGFTFNKLSQPSKNKEFRSAVNFYQLSQLCAGFGDYNNYDSIRNDRAEKTEVLKNLTAIIEEGNPVIVGCRFKKGTKTVGQVFTACGYLKNPDGSVDIALIDSDNIGKNIYITVDRDFGTCSFKNGNYGGAEILSLGYMTADDVLRLADGSQQKKDSYKDKFIIILEENSSLTLTNASGESLSYSENQFSGDMEYTVENYILNGVNHESEIMITVPQSESLVIETEDKALDITLSGNNGIFCGVDGTNVEKITAFPGEFTVEGKDMAYSITALSDEETVDLINFRSGESRKITFSSKNGITVKGERRQTLRLGLVSADGALKECDYQPQSFEYSVTADIVDVHVELEKTDHLRVLAFFGAFGVVVIASGIIIAVIVHKKKKNRKVK